MAGKASAAPLTTTGFSCTLPTTSATCVVGYYATFGTTSTNGGNTTYQPVIEPLLAAPIGQHVLIESRGALSETFTPRSNGLPGYDHTFFGAFTYLQGDAILTPHVTLVGGSFLIPFGTYNERLSPIWISNFQDGPLISSLGLMSTGTGLGGMLRGSAISRPGSG